MEADVVPIGIACCNAHFDLSIHVCVIQGDKYGFSGWSLWNACISHRWDVLLDSLLQCLIMDGPWVPCIKASAFVGSDAIHVDHRAQKLAMPNVMSSSRHWKRRRKPATLQQWTAVLWENYLVDTRGSPAA